MGGIGLPELLFLLVLVLAISFLVRWTVAGYRDRTPARSSTGTQRPAPSTRTVASAGAAAEFAAALSGRYSDSYTEAHAIVVIGKFVKGVARFLFIAILIAGFAMAHDSGNNSQRRGQLNSGIEGAIASLNWPVAGIAIALACLIGIPTYVLGILIAAQGQTALATLDTAVNSSRHLKDDDVARVLSKRFSL